MKALATVALIGLSYGFEDHEFHSHEAAQHGTNHRKNIPQVSQIDQSVKPLPQQTTLPQEPHPPVQPFWINHWIGQHLDNPNLSDGPKPDPTSRHQTGSHQPQDIIHPAPKRPPLKGGLPKTPPTNGNHNKNTGRNTGRNSGKSSHHPSGSKTQTQHYPQGSKTHTQHPPQTQLKRQILADDDDEFFIDEDNEFFADEDNELFAEQDDEFFISNKKPETHKPIPRDHIKTPNVMPPHNRNATNIYHHSNSTKIPKFICTRPPIKKPPVPQPHNNRTRPFVPTPSQYRATPRNVIAYEDEEFFAAEDNALFDLQKLLADASKTVGDVKQKPKNYGELLNDAINIAKDIKRKDDFEDSHFMRPTYTLDRPPRNSMNWGIRG